jgi:hypothetical protein
MTGKAKSDRQKRANADLKEKWMEQAIELYEVETHLKPQSLKKICLQVEVECLWMSGKLVKVTVLSLH